MGLFQQLKGQVAIATAGLPMRSPWSTAKLTRVVLADLAGVQDPNLSRADAMRIPGVARGRGLICGHLSRLPLTLWTADGSQQPMPAWLTSTKTSQSPRTRLLWTVDDLIFGGLSLWAVERDHAGQITDAVRVEPNVWSVDPDSRGVLVNGSPVPDDQVLLIEGPQEGLCEMAAAELRGMADMSAAWRQRVSSPVPLVEIKQTDQNAQLETDEVDELILDWEAARAAGGTAFVPPGFDVIAHGDIKTDLFVEGRNMARLDVANYLQVPASLLEGSLSTASLTYSTRDGERSDFIDTCLTYWGGAIEARLSLDDATPDGTAVRFDFTSLQTLPAPATTAITED